MVCAHPPVLGNWRADSVIYSSLIPWLSLQSMRVLDIPPCGHSMGQYLLMFVDQQDQGPVLLTPIYLLVGCSLPLWLFPFNKGVC